ncbi:hypothetical protein [Clostridium haemolyticum]|uniref:Uncharacterized protein n=1 Tax=Clostridium haemolyticum NCTC 9693 TaxID=1443114 RepID=A0ABR4TEF7_CLOHA|nr:hypothetical protein [Clostridium haemolyticum]KEI16729.1 hypothetical protein Z960_08620 [Clostridium haemolyticum NCTC 9693]KGN04521.1 hypothetical protein Z961_02575 [Clostridium haemolyticum NCTC 8350]
MLVKIQGWKLKNSDNIVQELNKYLNKKGSSKIEGFTVQLGCIGTNLPNTLIKDYMTVNKL